MRSRPFGLRAR